MRRALPWMRRLTWAVDATSPLPARQGRLSTPSSNVSSLPDELRDGEIAISYFATVNSTKPEAARHTWPELVPILTTHARLPRKDAGRLFSPVEYEEGHTRAKGDGPREMTLAVTDHDHGDGPEVLRKCLDGLAFAIYTTHSHTPEDPRLRAVVLLAEPVPVEKWPEFWERWCLFLEARGCHPDRACPDAKRMYYLPAAPPDAEVYAAEGHGAALTLEMLPELPPKPPAPPPRSTGTRASSASERYPADAIVAKYIALAGLGNRHKTGMELAVQLQANLYTPAEAEPLMLDYQRAVELCGDHLYTASDALTTLRDIYSTPTTKKPWTLPGSGASDQQIHQVMTGEPGKDEPGGDDSMDAQAQARESIAAAIETGTASAILDDPDVLKALAALPPGECTDWQQKLKKKIPAVNLRDLKAAIAASNGHRTKKNRSPEQDDQHLTDLGNARRLVSRHGADIRHDHQRGLWLIWDGRRWSPDDTSEITRRAKDTVAAMYKEAATLRSDSDRQAVVKHALQSEGRNAITNMIVLAASEPGVPVLAAHTDADPWLFNCQNGTIDLRTGELREHRREDLITKLAPVEYDPEATHPMWDDLLDRVTRGDSDTRAYLQKAAGYTLTGSTREDKAFCLVSEGGGGKTSFLEPIVKTMGGYATIAEDNTFVAQHAGASGHSEDVAALAGARLVICTEMGRGKLAEERFKRMTGGDSIRASRKHERSFEFTPQFKLWMAMNRALRADDEDTGVWRRLRYIPWLPIPEDERDPRVKETLLRDTAARKAILAWMVAGCRAYLSDGLGDPPAVIAATEHRREENNPMAAFFDDCCVFAPDAWTPARALREAYEDWCKDSGARPVNLGDWGRRLHERGAKNGRDYVRGRHWEGVGLLIFERGMSVMSVHDSPSPHTFHDSSHVGENGRTTDMHRHDCHEDGVSDGSDDGVEIVEEVL